MSLTLYTARICPYAQRATMALAHLEIPHSAIEIDLQNKPTDYAEKVNKASKVPVLAFDNTNVKIPESLVILELLADLNPGKIFLNNGSNTEIAIKKAEARYFVGKLIKKFNDY